MSCHAILRRNVDFDSIFPETDDTLVSSPRYPSFDVVHHTSPDIITRSEITTSCNIYVQFAKNFFSNCFHKAKTMFLTNSPSKWNCPSRLPTVCTESSPAHLCQIRTQTKEQIIYYFSLRSRIEFMRFYQNTIVNLRHIFTLPSASVHNQTQNNKWEEKVNQYRPINTYFAK